MSRGRYSNDRGSIKGMRSAQSESLDRPGFQTDGYIDKKGTPSGEGATFNKMPPGMDITNQECAEFNSMPLKMVTDMGYPGDGAFAVKDVPE